MRVVNGLGRVTVEDLLDQMRERLGALTALSRGSDRYGSELLEGQRIELELWLDRLSRVREAERVERKQVQPGPSQGSDRDAATHPQAQ